MERGKLVGQFAVLIAFQHFEYAVLVTVEGCEKRGIESGFDKINGKYLPVYRIGAGKSELCSVIPSYGVDVFVFDSEIQRVSACVGRGVARNLNVVAVLFHKFVVCLFGERGLQNILLSVLADISKVGNLGKA